LYHYSVNQFSEFCCHNPLCCFSTSVCCFCCCCCLFRYRLSPETYGYTLVLSDGRIYKEHTVWFIRR